MAFFLKRRLRLVHWICLAVVCVGAFAVLIGVQARERERMVQRGALAAEIDLEGLRLKVKPVGGCGALETARECRIESESESEMSR